MPSVDGSKCAHRAGTARSRARRTRSFAARVLGAGKGEANGKESSLAPPPSPSAASLVCTEELAPFSAAAVSLLLVALSFAGCEGAGEGEGARKTGWRLSSQMPARESANRPSGLSSSTSIAQEGSAQSRRLIHDRSEADEVIPVDFRQPAISSSARL